MKDGGPAFPGPYSFDETGQVGHQDKSAQQGMSLRQYYAGLAMQGIKSNDELLRRIMDAAERSDKPQQELIAVMARKDADALIAELEKAP